MSRDNPRGRHRVPAPRRPVEGARTAPVDQGPDRDPELDSYLAALAPESIPGATELTGRFGSAQVFALRLPALRIEQLRRLAAARGVSPGALAVDWVLERLDAAESGAADLGTDDAVTGPLPRTVEVDVAAPSWRSALRRLGRQ